MNEHLNQKEIDKLLNDLNNITINFDKIDKIIFPRIDISNCVFTGTAIGERHEFGKGNLLNCELKDFIALKIDFEYVDIKDCIVKQSKFSKANFDFGAFINNVFHQCLFEESHFNNLSITESKFYHVDFINCDLQNMVIKGCTFRNCTFVNCKTSNKLIESSCIFDCIFDNTEIQIETITENFGLAKENLKDVNIRSGRKRNTHFFIPVDELIDHLYEGNESAFDRLKIAFFLDRDLFIKGDDKIDDIFQVENWIALCRIPSTFTNLLDLLLEFLLHEYENDKAILFVLLKFHEMTSKLTEQIKIQNDLYKSVMGVHMTLARIVETFLMLIFVTAKETNLPNLSFKAYGPIDISFYESELHHFLLPGQIVVNNVKKMNSPNVLSFLSDNIEAISILLGLLFSTRLKVELSKYYPDHEKVESSTADILYLPENTKNVPNKLEEMSLFNIDLGLAKSKLDEKYLYTIKLRSIMPGHLLATLRLDVNTKAIGKVRKVIVDVIKKED